MLADCAVEYADGAVVHVTGGLVAGTGAIVTADGRLAGSGRVVDGAALCFHTDSLPWSVDFSKADDSARGETGRVGS